MLLISNLKLIKIKILDIPTDTVAQSVEPRKTCRGPGFNPIECQIFNLFFCILSSLLPWRSIGICNIDRGLHNFIMLIKKQRKNKILCKNRINCGHA